MTVDILITFGIQFTLTSIGQNMLVHKYEFDEIEASQLLMLPYLIVCFLLPIVGYLADRFGRRQSIIIFTGFL